MGMRMADMGAKRECREIMKAEVMEIGNSRQGAGVGGPR